MKKCLCILFLIISSFINAQNFSQSGTVYGINNIGIPNIRIQLWKRTVSTSIVSNLTTKVFSTHNGNGSTSQYANYPMSLTEMDKCFNTSFSNTILRWSGTKSSSIVLNWSSWGTLSSNGVTVPNNGEYFSTEVTGTFVPAESGTYTFGINSDDGSDLLINGVLVKSFYGGHGMSGYQYGTINLVAGTQYTFKARMQEYGGGEGLAVVWKRPSQSTYSLQVAELGTTTINTSAWTLDTTVLTNALGNYNISRPSLATNEWRIILDTLSIPAPQRINVLDNTNLIFNKRTINGADYFRYDLNTDNNFSVSDIYLQIKKRRGLIWSVPNYRIYTQTDHSIIRTSILNLRSTYPGTQSFTTSTLTNSGITNFYIIRTGYDN
jgi:hypothetical protein